MATARIFSTEVQELIARINIRIIQTNQIVAISRALVRETRHIINPRIAALEEFDSLSYENDWAASEITSHRGPVES